MNLEIKVLFVFVLIWLVKCVFKYFDNSISYFVIVKLYMFIVFIVDNDIFFSKGRIMESLYMYYGLDCRLLYFYSSDGLMDF